MKTIKITFSVLILIFLYSCNKKLDNYEIYTEIKGEAKEIYLDHLIFDSLGQKSNDLKVIQKSYTSINYDKGIIESIDSTYAINQEKFVFLTKEIYHFIDDKLESVERFDSDELIGKYVTLNYNSKGLPKETKYVGSISLKEFYEYNDSSIVFSTYYEEEIISKVYKKFDKNGIIKFIRSDFFEQNPSDNSFYITFYYDFKFDQKGNWIERKGKTEGSILSYFIDRRKIIYE
ncbi:MAG: hypothetical protein ACK5WV_09320 [Chryseotalea sp.]|jgi:hypothetical protein